MSVINSIDRSTKLSLTKAVAFLEEPERSEAFLSKPQENFENFTRI